MPKEENEHKRSDPDGITTRLEGDDWHITVVLRGKDEGDKRAQAVAYLLVTLMDLTSSETPLGERVHAAYKGFIGALRES